MYHIISYIISYNIIYIHIYHMHACTTLYIIHALHMYDMNVPLYMQFKTYTYVHIVYVRAQIMGSHADCLHGQTISAR